VIGSMQKSHHECKCPRNDEATAILLVTRGQYARIVNVHTTVVIVARIVGLLLMLIGFGRTPTKEALP